MNALQVLEAGPEHAEQVHGVIHRAFSARPVLDPPSTATRESVESVAATLERSGGLLVLRRSMPVGAMLFDRSRPRQLGLTRVSVDPAQQGHGVASAMVGVAEDVAESLGLDAVWLLSREELPENQVFWSRRGYLPVAASGPVIELGKTLWLALPVATAEDMQRLGERLAGLCRPGDVVVLTGGLGAGKTTLAQGIGSGLAVRGPVTSPTFVIAREHPSLAGGPALVHADAYRLGGAAELDDLDLDTSLAESVTVVEWGHGLAEGLSDSWLDVRIDRIRGDGGGDGLAALAAAGPWRDRPQEQLDRGEDCRVVSVRPHGPRWVGSPLRSTLLAEARVPC
uniref:tRNA threonylcarbamoyladenosine biosynthesis protein TsaE n=1 Tax=uncultured Nocardioidaceae bacterium TaxID=253824 RepID=A0A6J4MDK6_9ACTN|nr:MAG: tRNA threonylcarbamoyladenosine biosynthesis protein TsaE [uncultured Nocardioidaceae bacterium]